MSEQEYQIINHLNIEPDAPQPAVIASTSQRFYNLLLDTFFYIIFSFIFGLIIGTVLVISGRIDLIEKIDENILGFVLIFIYYFSQEIIFGKTIGKWITGTKVICADGKQLTTGKALGRTLCRFIPFEAFSFFGGQGSPRGWHDRIANTIVISTRHL